MENKDEKIGFFKYVKESQGWSIGVLIVLMFVGIALAIKDSGNNIGAIIGVLTLFSIIIGMFYIDYRRKNK